MQPLESEQYGLDSIPFIAPDLDYLAENAGHPHIKSKSRAFLEFRDGPTPLPELPPFGLSSLSIQQAEQVVEESQMVFQPVVSMYPNPSPGIVFFDLPNLDEDQLKLRFFELGGRLVFEFTSDSNTNGERLDLSELDKGLYLVEVSLGGVIIEVQKLMLK